VIFTETELAGAYIIDLEPIGDERGFFARNYCEREFAKHHLCTHWVQCNISFNAHRATLRGMHFQSAPHEEAKLVRVTNGAVFDAIVDLREDSPTFCHHVTVELSAANRRMLYVPEGFAHGFLTLEPDTEIFYQMSEFYAPECATGVRYDDPAFAISWPEEPDIISERDAAYPDFSTAGKQL